MTDVKDAQFLNVSVLIVTTKFGKDIDVMAVPLNTAWPMKFS